METSCVLSGVHVASCLGFSARLEFHVGYILILYIGVFPAIGEGGVPA